MYYTVQDYKDIYSLQIYIYIYVHASHCLLDNVSQKLPKNNSFVNRLNPSGFCEVAVGDLCEYAVDQCIRLQELPEHVRHGRLSTRSQNIEEI